MGPQHAGTCRLASSGCYNDQLTLWGGLCAQVLTRMAQRKKVGVSSIIDQILDHGAPKVLSPRQSQRSCFAVLSCFELHQRLRCNHVFLDDR